MAATAAAAGSRGRGSRRSWCAKGGSPARTGGGDRAAARVQWRHGHGRTPQTRRALTIRRGSKGGGCAGGNARAATPLPAAVYHRAAARRVQLCPADPTIVAPRRSRRQRASSSPRARGGGGGEEERGRGTREAKWSCCRRDSCHQLQPGGVLEAARRGRGGVAAVASVCGERVAGPAAPAAGVSPHDPPLARARPLWGSPPRRGDLPLPSGPLNHHSGAGGGVAAAVRMRASPLSRHDPLPTASSDAVPVAATGHPPRHPTRPTA